MKERRVMERRAVYAPSSGVLSFMAGLLVGVAMAWTFSALAAERSARFQWIEPTQNVDGSPLEPGDLLELRLYRQAGPGPELVQTFEPGNTEAVLLLELDDGIHCFHMTALATGGESAASNVSCRVWSATGTGEPVVFVIPAAPTGFGVELI